MYGCVEWEYHILPQQAIALFCSYMLSFLQSCSQSSFILAARIYESFRYLQAGPENMLVEVFELPTAILLKVSIEFGHSRDKGRNILYLS